LKAHPTIRGVWGITSVAFPGAAAAIRDAGRSGEVAVVGLATPNGMKEYVRDGTVETVLLWNPVDLGYLTVLAAVAAVRNDTLGASLTAGRLGEVTVLDDQVLLGAPMQFDKDNIEEFDF
jgi:rhamnose transport system substrate-binding protein